MDWSELPKLCASVLESDAAASSMSAHEDANQDTNRDICNNTPQLPGAEKLPGAETVTAIDGDSDTEYPDSQEPVFKIDWFR